MAHLREFTKYLLPYWDKVLLIFIINNAVQLSTLLPPLLIKILFDTVYPNKDFQLLIIISLIPFILSIILNGLTVLRSIIELFINQEIYKKLYGRFYSKVQRLPISFFKTHGVGDILHRMTDDLQAMESVILSTIPNLMLAGIKLLVMLAICLTMNIPITLLALIGIPIQFWQTHYFSKKMSDIRLQQQAVNGELFNFLEERLSNIKLIKLFHRWSQEVSLLLKNIYGLFRIERETRLTQSLHNIVSVLTTRGWSVVIGIYMGVLVIQDQLSIGQVIALTWYLGLLQDPFDTIAGLYGQLRISKASFDRVGEILNAPDEWSDYEIGNQHIDIQGKIAFQNVCFSYNNQSDIPILNHLNFEIKAGESVALVGRSGIGKSSIVDLILRFYTPQSGQILIDDIPLNDIHIAALREQVALIPQDVCLFSGSIRDNLTFGLKQTVSDDELIEAIRTANAQDFVLGTTEGLDATVGPKGQNLSGGQRQRLAIARALLTNPKVIIFDEATSALDGETEKEIQKTIETLKGKRTIIVIAHRLSALTHVDRVFVIGPSGNVMEEGTLHELMEKESAFQKLYEFQLARFQTFMTQLELLIKSAGNRPLSMAIIKITNIEDIEKELKDKMRSFIENCGTVLSLLIRNTDTCCYQSNGRFWVVFPDTDYMTAKIHCDRLIDYFNQTNFVSDINQKSSLKQDIRYITIQHHRKETAQQFKTRLSQEAKTYFQEQSEKGSENDQ